MKLMADEATQEAEVKPSETAPSPQPTVTKIPAPPGPVHTPSKHARFFMIIGILLLMAGIIFSIKTLRTRNHIEEPVSNPVPAQVDSVTCQQKQPSGDTQWVYAMNNDQRYCASTWLYARMGLGNTMADPLGIGAIYTLKDTEKEPYTRTVSSLKGVAMKDAKGPDKVQGLDSYIPLDSKGKKVVECTNPAGKENVFKNADKDISFKVRYTNTGSVDWDSKKNIRLVAPNGNTTFGKYFFTGQYDVVTSSGGTEKRDVVKPGETAEFSATLKLPVKQDKTNPQDGWYIMWWVMSDSNNVPFGEIAYCAMQHNSGTALVKTPATFLITQPAKE